MQSDRSSRAILDEIAALSRADDLARLVHTAAFAAADERRTALSDGLAELIERAGLAAEDLDTPLGNLSRAMERGASEGAGSSSHALVSGLLGRAIALTPPEGAEAEARVAETLLWLATNTPTDALPYLDAALEDKASGLWVAIAALVRRADAGNAPAVGRAGALIGAAALVESESPAAREEATALARDVRDPVVRSLLAPAPSGAQPGAPAAEPSTEGGDTPIAGELVAPPRGPIVLFLLGVTGILLAMHAARTFLRYALKYRQPAELRVSATGVTVVSKTELLGRTLGTRETHVPIESLLRASREIAYPRVAMYAGLVALALGSYLGVSLLADGARAGSPELLAIGALFVAIGVAVDYVLENARTGSQGRCRVVFVVRKGRAFAIGGVDPARADAALARLIRRA